MSERFKILNYIPKIPIPELFYSDAEKKPLKCCVMCERNVYENGELYFIEKNFKYNKKYDLKETLFEYAICIDCYREMSSRMSELSTRRIEAYVGERFNPLRRMESLLNEHGLELNPWIETCAMTNKSFRDCEEFQLCAMCIGDEMVFSHLPLMLSDDAIYAINELMSAETREEMDRFRDEYFGIPPELSELFKTKTPMLF